MDKVCLLKEWLKHSLPSKLNSPIPRGSVESRKALWEEEV